MSNFEILSLVVTFVCLFSFCIVFTILFRNYNLNAIKDVKEGKEDIELIDGVLLEEEKKKNKKTKVLRIIGRVTYYAIYGFVFAFFIFSLTSRILDNSILIGNSGYVVIASASMATKNKDNTYLATLDDQIEMYDIIGVSKYSSASEVKLYDIVAFKANDGRTIVHRIISLNNDNGNLQIITRGDANSSSDNNSLYDGYLTYDDLIGYYNHKNIPLVGSFVIFLQSNSGIITIVSIGYCVFMFDFYRNKLEKAILDRTNLLIELIDYDDHDANLTNYFQQELVYKGYKYIFNEGNFIKKEEINDLEVINESKDKMYTKLSSSEEKSPDKLYVKDIKDDQVTNLDSSKENFDKKSLTDFIKDLINKDKN